MPDVKALVLVHPKSRTSAGKANVRREASHEMWLRRQALNIVALLPDEQDDALRVLALAQTAVQDFWRIEPR